MANVVQISATTNNGNRPTARNRQARAKTISRTAKRANGIGTTDASQIPVQITVAPRAQSAGKKAGRDPISMTTESAADVRASTSVIVRELRPR